LGDCLSCAWVPAITQKSQNVSLKIQTKFGSNSGIWAGVRVLEKIRME
jgi:hypothetical protein